MTYRAIRLLAQAAKAEKKSKQFWRIINNPKKKKRWMDRINWQKATNKLKAIKRQTGQKFFDFNQGGEIRPRKYLAGGLLNPLIRTGMKTKGYKGFAKEIKKYIQDYIKFNKTSPTVGKLEGKRLKIEAIKSSLNKGRKEMSKNLFLQKHYFDAASKVGAYEKKLKAVTKAYMHKKANPQIKTHSEGGEIVIGKNVDKDLL